VAVKAAPAGIASGDIERLLREIFDAVEKEARQVSLEALQQKIAASVSCRAAIKVNMPLTESKMQWLLGELAHTQNPATCPPRPSHCSALQPARHPARLQTHLSDQR